MSDWYTRYRISDGEYGGSSALLKNMPNPMPDGWAIKAHIGEGKKQNGLRWSKTLKDYEAIPPSRKLSVAEFFQKFTEDEMQAYSEADSSNLRKVRRVIEDRNSANMPIDKDSPRTVRMLNILVSESIITTERKTEILA